MTIESWTHAKCLDELNPSLSSQDGLNTVMDVWINLIVNC